MNWIKETIELGKIKPNKEISFKYHYEGDKEIKEVIPGCKSCTTATLKEDIVYVTYKSTDFPQHLRNEKDEVEFEKTIDVVYEDGSIDVLSFEGTLVK